MFGAMFGAGGLFLNKYTMTAVACLGLLVGAYGYGYMSARDKCQARALRAQVASLKHQIAIRDDTIAAHNKRAMRDAEALAAQDRKLREIQTYVDKIPDSDCLSGDDARQLQSIFGAE